ncbi:hypothetical protein [Saccharothrix sp.]|uniref:hypothetical protein n=1 Tax=Saccharothrix sp. TaxID=1873460 RepID=UPI0028115736|nr:hypothetical protein [Saccharothrix sp.]
MTDGTGLAHRDRQGHPLLGLSLLAFLVLDALIGLTRRRADRRSGAADEGPRPARTVL